MNKLIVYVILWPAAVILCLGVVLAIGAVKLAACVCRMLGVRKV